MEFIEEESQLRREQLSKFDRIQQADVISNHYNKNASISRDLYHLLEFRKKAPQNEEVDSLILSISNMLILSHRKDFGIPLEWKSQNN